MFSPLYLKIFEKSPFLMKTPTQNFAHHTEVKKHPFGVKTPILATLTTIHTYYSVLQEGLSVPLAPWLRRAAESEMFVWNMNNPNHVDLEKLWYTKTNY